MRWYCATYVTEDGKNTCRVSNSKSFLEDWLASQDDAVKTHIGKWKPSKYKPRRKSAAQRKKNAHKPWMNSE